MLLIHLTFLPLFEDISFEKSNPPFPGHNGLLGRRLVYSNRPSRPNNNNNNKNKENQRPNNDITLNPSSDAGVSAGNQNISETNNRPRPKTPGNASSPRPKRPKRPNFKGWSS